MVSWKLDIDISIKNLKFGRQHLQQFKEEKIEELKEEYFFQIKYVPEGENNTDLFTKNFPIPTFKKHVQKYWGTDVYIKLDKVQQVIWDLPNPWAREDVSGIK